MCSPPCRCVQIYLVGLIFGAILFELVQHAIKHYLAHHKKRGKHYSTKLWQRINEELMVLGECRRVGKKGGGLLVVATGLP